MQSSFYQKQFAIWLENKQDRTQMTIDTERLEKQLKTLSEEEQRYIQAYGSGVITIEQLKVQSDNIQKKIKELKARMNQANNPESQKPALFVNVKEICDKLSSTIKNISFEQKRLLVSNVIKEVIVGSGQKVVVKGLLPLNFNQFSYALSDYNNKLNAQDQHSWVAECRQVDVI